MWSSGIFLVSLALLAAPTGGKTSSASRGNGRSIQIVNQSGTFVEVHWINPSTKETVRMSDPHIVPGADFNLNSYVGHEFEAQEMPGKDGQCVAQVCRKTNFAVSPNDNQIITIPETFEAVFIDNKIKAHLEASNLIAECQSLATQSLQTAGSDKAASLKAMQGLVECVEGGVAERLEKVNEEIAFQASIRTGIAAQLENYTCADDTLNSTDDVSSHTWAHKEEALRLVHIKLDRPASKIHVIENFILEDECRAMEEQAVKKLHHATVADGKGGSRLSENRKAMQAGINVPWDKETAGDPIARLSRRVYDYTNHVLGLGIEEHGQEDLMSIQYFGRGANDTEPDRYTPHCDGDCTGLTHKHGTRMATMVMYCDVPERGGHTNFRNAGVHVKPEAGNGVFFSYIDPDAKIMDTGFTEHSGCPVYEGEKKIVTQWVRYGVSAIDPWDSFNTLGIKKSEMIDGEELNDDEAKEPQDEL